MNIRPFDLTRDLDGMLDLIEIAFAEDETRRAETAGAVADEIDNRGELGSHVRMLARKGRRV